MSGHIHILKQWPCSGGMGAMARLHAERGEGIYAFGAKRDQSAATGAHPVVKTNPVLVGSATPNHPVRKIAAEARTLWQKEGWSAGIFYNGYGLRWGIAPRPENRQILYLHSDFPGLSRWLPGRLPWADGVICVNAALREKILRLFPSFPPERIFVVPYPANVPTAEAPPSAGRPAVIGYAGRIQIPQKRLDRIKAFLAELSQRGIDWRMEFLGEGEALEKLRRALLDPRVVFHGHQSGERYAEILGSWKYLLFTSDYEGLPVALLEGVARGLVPVYPDFYDGTDWVAGLRRELLYPVGNMAAAAGVVARVEEMWGADDWAHFHQRARAQLRAHTTSGYFAAFDEAINALSALPPIRHTPKAPSWGPLWVHHRMEAWHQSGGWRSCAW